MNLFEFLTLFGPGLAAQAIVFAVVRKQFAWRWWEITLPWIAPYAWYSLCGSGYGPTKSLANLGEFLVLSIWPAGYWIVRGLFWKKPISGGIGLLLAAAFAACAIAIYFLVPTLPE